MAYGEIYRMEYYDQLIEGSTGRKTTVKILRKDYTGSFSYITGASDPVRFSGKTDNDYLFATLVATSCDLYVISDVNFKFLDIFSADSRKHKVEVWKEAYPGAPSQTLWWTGYILPDNYIEPLHYHKDYEVRFTCTDGIGSLKNADLLDNNGKYFYGKADLNGAINTILQYKTGLTLPMYFALSFDEIYTSTLYIEGNEWNNVFGKIYIDWETFYEKGVPKCDYVLEQILQPFGARLIQSKGYWVITEVTKNADSHYRYDSGFGKTLFNPVKAYTGKSNRTANRLFFADKGGDLQINPAFKEFSIHHDFLKRKSIIKNPSFEKWQKISSPSGLPTDFGDYSFSNWTKSPSNGRFVKPSLNSDGKTYFVQMAGLYSGINLSEFIESDPINVHLENRTAYFSISVRKYWFHTQLEIKIGTKYINDLGNLQDAVYRHNIDPVSPNDFSKYEININAASYTGDLIVRIYRPYNPSIPNGGIRGYFHMDDVIFRFTDVDSAQEDIYFDVTIDQNNNYIPDVIESIVGDVPNILDREDIYLGTFWRCDNSGNYLPSLLWSRAGEGYATILQQLADLIVETHRVPKQFLTGLKLKGNFDFDSCIEISFMDNKRYIPIHWENSDKFCTWVIDCIEILADRLMATELFDFITTEDGNYIKV